MAIISTCPQPGELQKLGSGELLLHEVEVLVHHLEACPQCLARLPTLPVTDTLNEMLSQAATRIDVPDEPIVSALIARLVLLAQPLTFPCAGCGKVLKVKAHLAGKLAQCPICKQTTPIPQPASLRLGDGPTAATSEATPPAAAAAEMKRTTYSDLTQDLPDAERESAGGAWNFLAPPQQSDEIGRLGHYRILKVLGAGGMGVVFQAEDPHLKRWVALKAMLPALAVSASAKKRFLREAQSAAKLKHDHVVAIYAVSEDRGVPFLAMEYLEGEPLDQYLQRQGRLPLAEICRLGREIAEGLRAAHDKGMVHRDIKPANIWLESRGIAAETRVKILDFGLARDATEENGLTLQGAVIGTPMYMAPEQGRGEPVDARCDLFSLGVVLYRMGTGHVPFQGKDTISTLVSVATHEPPAPLQLNHQLPPALSDLVMRLLAKDPAQRCSSAAEVIAVLTKLEKQGNLQPQGRTESHREPDTLKLGPAQQTIPTASFASPARKHPRALLLGAVALLCALVGGAAAYQFLFRAPNGTLLVEVEGNDADVRFRHGKLLVYDADGKTLLYTLSPSATTKDLPLGKYLLKVEGADGLTLDTPRFEMTKKGWKVRVSSVSPLLAQEDEKSRMPPSAEKGVLDFAEIHAADEPRFDRWILQMKKAGFRPTRLTVQTVKDAPLYTAVAVKQEQPQSWEFSRVKGNVAEHLNEHWQRKYEAVAQAIYREQNATHEAYLWVQDQALDNNGIWTGESVFIAAKIKAAAKHKAHLLSRCAVFVENEPVYCILLEDPDGVPWKESYNLQLDACKAWIKAQQADGWRPDHLCYYGIGSKRLFGAVLIKDASHSDWDVSWSLTPAGYEKELVARRAQGFRPLTALSHEDQDGVLCLSAIWIRYRIPSAEKTTP